MSSERRLEDLLEECLAAYDAGLSPDECLSAFPEQRQRLEPLFRQALAARIAFARSPRPEFKQQARARFLFAAGREVRRAFDAQPDPEFVREGRRRFIAAAGAAAQEALRSVPPPRLAFWMNARRRLLEAAVARQARRPAHQPAFYMLRAGLGAAVVAVAISLAGLAYLSGGSGPPTVSAEYAALERDWQQFEQQRASGQAPSERLYQQLTNLTRRTNDLLAKLDDRSLAQPIEVARVENLVNRQREVVNQELVNQTILAGEPPPELREAQQQVQQAEQVVAVVRIKIAQIENTAQAQAAADPASPTSAPEPTPPATATPAAPTASGSPASGGPAATATRPPAPTPTPEPLHPDQVIIALAADRTYGFSWQQIETGTIRFLAPADWLVEGIVVRNGITTVDGSQLVLRHGEAVTIAINIYTGRTQAIVLGQAMILRGDGHEARTISNEDLLARVGGNYALQLRYFTDSIELLTAAPEMPTPTSTSTPSPSPTSTPARTSTAGPTGTP